MQVFSSAHPYVRHVNEMLVKSLRAMPGFPADIERKIRNQNVRFRGPDIPILQKRQTQAVEILYWLYQRNQARSPMDVYHFWNDLKTLKWKGHSYVEILALFDTWKAIIMLKSSVVETHFTNFTEITTQIAVITESSSSDLWSTSPFEHRMTILLS